MLRRLFILIAKTFFREVTIKGTENLPSSGPLIFTPNHPNSLIDPILLYFLPPQYRIRFVAKAPLFNITLLGWLMRKLRAIPVLRRFEADGNVDYKAFFASCVEALSAGDSIAIFPEGASLPQPHMTTLRTGAARLYFLAKEKNIDVTVIPVALNYEHGSIFRTSVVVSFAPPINTTKLIENYATAPNDAVRELTALIGKVLHDYVFQANDYRDRELMLLLERIYKETNGHDTWPERLDRLKKFEDGMSILRDSCAYEIGRLRHMLLRYEGLEKKYKNIYKYTDLIRNGSFKRILMIIFGFPFALLGVIFNFLPYQLCKRIVISIKKYDESVLATYKVIYSLFLYPLIYVAEGLLINKWLGTTASTTFSLLIIPLSYFTLFYFEWLYDDEWGIILPSFLLRKSRLDRISKLIENQRYRIKDQVDKLAARLDILRDQSVGEQS